MRLATAFLRFRCVRFAGWSCRLFLYRFHMPRIVVTLNKVSFVYLLAQFAEVLGAVFRADDQQVEM